MYFMLGCFFSFHILLDTPHLRIALLGWHQPTNTDQLSSALLLQQPKERRGGWEENEAAGSAARSGHGDKGPGSDLVLAIQPGTGRSPQLGLQQPLGQWSDVTWTCKMPPGKSRRRNHAWVQHPKEEHLQQLVLPCKVWVKLPVEQEHTRPFQCSGRERPSRLLSIVVLGLKSRCCGSVHHWALRVSLSWDEQTTAPGRVGP